MLILFDVWYFKKEKDFLRSIGKEVDIKTYKAINKVKDFTGILKEYDGNTCSIELEDETTMTFELKEIALIRLALDF